MFELNNRIIVVTGGSRGIGRAIVKLLLEHKAHVICINKNTDVDLDVKQIKADVGNYEEMKLALTAIEYEVGPIYGIVSNAGINDDMLYKNMTLKQWRDVLTINLDGAFNTTHPIINKMYERMEGSIVYIGSIVGMSGNIGQVNYAASKAGLVGMAKSLALEGARNNVRVNVIAPGFTKTSMMESIPNQVIEKIKKKIPLNKFAEPEDIAWGVLYLLSPKLSSFVTGETININGGQSMQ